MKYLARNYLIIVCLMLSVFVAGCAGTSVNESTGEYLDDTVVTTKVKSKLAESEKTSALAIDVDTFKGIVQLSGFVNSIAEKEAAAQIAEEVPGVLEVKNNILIK